MRECNYSDRAAFKKVLKSNRLPQISPNKPIPYKIANKITRQLVNRNIDWYKYTQQARDLVDSGPLKQNSTDFEKELIEAWYKKILVNNKVELPAWDCLLGFASVGGFLEGKDIAEFSVRLDFNINLLVGDRGAGKSTILNLLALFAASISQETDALVTRLTNILSSDNIDDLSTNIDVSSFTRSMKQLLNRYSVKKIALFFTRKQKAFCYFVNLEDRSFDLLELSQDGKWLSVDSNKLIKPRILVLQQGEVTRISEGRGDIYLNKILDALSPSLYQKRVDLIGHVKQIFHQFEATNFSYVKIEPDSLFHFIDKREKELNIINKNAKQRYFSEKSYKILRSYVKQCRSFINKGEWNNSGDIPVFQLLEKRGNAFFVAYVGQVLSFVERKLDQIKQLMQVTEQIRVNSQTNNRIFLENSELLNTIQQLTNRLQICLEELHIWGEIYAREHIKWDKGFSSLIANYVSLLRDKIDLIDDQEGTCQHMTRKLNEDNLEIKIFTLNASMIVADYQNEIDSLLSLEELYYELFHTTFETTYSKISNISRKYTSITRQVKKIIRNFRESSEEKLFEFVYIPVDIQLRQGSVYRTLHQLSFGQKSGIILKMVLSASGNHPVILDQPEDNLDANAIINILTPTLRRLSKKRQVIIATHNPNLVLGLLQTKNLIVLESWGESGRIKVQGSPLEREIASELLDILEGGKYVFEHRMKIFGEFITHVAKQIKDIDIGIIENSFRKYTIDKFRNNLQSIISDRDALDIVRHELKQKKPTYVHTGLQNVQNEIEKLREGSGRDIDQLLMQIEEVTTLLRIHTTQLENAIEEIRQMDTQAKPRQVDLFSLLTDLRGEYFHALQEERNIQIKIEESLSDYFVYSDRDHLKLVFRNLFQNSLRATERKVIQFFDTDDKIFETITIELFAVDDNQITLLFSDNGIGMTKDLKSKLYIERCTTQHGRDNGLGGIIISKLLEINKGSIKITESNPQIGTKQLITLNRESIIEP